MAVCHICGSTSNLKGVITLPYNNFFSRYKKHICQGCTETSKNDSKKEAKVEAKCGWQMPFLRKKNEQLKNLMQKDFELLQQMLPNTTERRKSIKQEAPDGFSSDQQNQSAEIVEEIILNEEEVEDDEMTNYNANEYEQDDEMNQPATVETNYEIDTNQQTTNVVWEEEAYVDEIVLNDVCEEETIEYPNQEAADDLTCSQEQSYSQQTENDAEINGQTLDTTQEYFEEENQQNISYVKYENLEEEQQNSQHYFEEAATEEIQQNIFIKPEPEENDYTTTLQIMPSESEQNANANNSMEEYSKQLKDKSQEEISRLQRNNKEEENIKQIKDEAQEEITRLRRKNKQLKDSIQKDFEMIQHLLPAKMRASMPEKSAQQTGIRAMTICHTESIPNGNVSQANNNIAIQNVVTVKKEINQDDDNNEVCYMVEEFLDDYETKSTSNLKNNQSTEKYIKYQQEFQHFLKVSPKAENVKKETPDIGNHSDSAIINRSQGKPHKPPTKVICKNIEKLKNIQRNNQFVKKSMDEDIKIILQLQLQNKSKSVSNRRSIAPNNAITYRPRSTLAHTTNNKNEATIQNDNHCPTCGALSSSWESLSRHVKKLHPHQNYRSYLEKKGFIILRKLGVSERTPQKHTELNQVNSRWKSNQARCSSSTISSKTNLRNINTPSLQKKIEHIENVFECILCPTKNLRFNSITALNAHLKSEHSHANNTNARQQYIYKCIQCDMDFSSEHDLREHACSSHIP